MLISESILQTSLAVAGTIFRRIVSYDIRRQDLSLHVYAYVYAYGIDHLLYIIMIPLLRVAQICTHVAIQYAQHVIVRAPETVGCGKDDAGQKCRMSV